MTWLKHLAYSKNFINVAILSAVIITALYNHFVDDITNERIYLRGFFQVVRRVYDSTFGYLPFPSVYIVLVVLLGIIFIEARRLYTSFSKRSLLEFLIKSFRFTCVFYVAFYWTWGFNYKNRPLQEQLNFVETKIDSNEVFQEASYIMSQLIPLRNNISQDTMPLTNAFYNKNSEQLIRIALKSLLNSWDLPSKGEVRVRQLFPKGTLLHFSSAGIYIPFAFEGHYDAGVASVYRPFVMAHEMSHGYGITDEGECNFLAVLICANTNNDFIRYSGLLSYWRYLASSLASISPNLRDQLRAQISSAVRNDLINIQSTHDAYVDIMPRLRDLIYDSYLKSNGVKAGLESYGTVVELMQYWKKTSHNRELFDKMYNSEN